MSSYFRHFGSDGYSFILAILIFATSRYVVSFLQVFIIILWVFLQTEKDRQLQSIQDRLTKQREKREPSPGGKKVRFP